MAKEKIYIPTFISDGKYTPTIVQPRLLFYNGTKECNSYWIQNSTGNTEVSVYPYFDHYSGSVPTGDSKSLLFYNEDPAFGTKPTETLYSEYWDKYISLLYNPRTRLLNCSAIIPLSVYNGLTLNDIVEFRGNCYYLRAINDYNLKSGNCTLQLLGPIIEDSIVPSVVDPTLHLPSVTVDSIDSITYQSMMVNCNVGDQGSDIVTDRGICYSKTEINPNQSNSTVIHNGNGEGYYSCEMTGLDFNTMYYITAFATSSIGTIYTLPITGMTVDRYMYLNLEVGNGSSDSIEYNWEIYYNGNTEYYTGQVSVGTNDTIETGLRISKDTSFDYLFEIISTQTTSQIESSSTYGLPDYATVDTLYELFVGTSSTNGYYNYDEDYGQTTMVLQTIITD